MEGFTERSPNAIASVRIPGVDPTEQITNRCNRIVKVLDRQDGGCALCRTHDFCNSGFKPETVITCDQEFLTGDWICSSDCERVNAALRELFEKRVQKLPVHLLHGVTKMCPEEECDGADLNISRRVLHGRISSFDESQSLLSRILSVFHLSSNIFTHIKWHVSP